jgi:hypothetical protein
VRDVQDLTFERQNGLRLAVSAVWADPQQVTLHQKKTSVWRDLFRNSLSVCQEIHIHIAVLRRVRSRLSGGFAGMGDFDDLDT